MRTRKYQWFIAPARDTETNEKLGSYLAHEGKIYESEDRIVFNDKPIPGYNVPYKIVTYLTKAAKVFPFKFRVFVKEGEGQWRESKLHQKQPISVRSKEGKKRFQEIVAQKKK